MCWRIKKQSFVSSVACIVLIIEFAVISNSSFIGFSFHLDLVVIVIIIDKHAKLISLELTVVPYKDSITSKATPSTKKSITNE